MVLDSKHNIAAAHIRALREAKGITQAQAAELCELAFRTYQGAEDTKSKSNPSVDTLLAIAKGYNVSVAVLLGDTRPSIVQVEHDLGECLARVSKATRAAHMAEENDRAAEKKATDIALSDAKKSATSQPVPSRRKG